MALEYVVKRNPFGSVLYLLLTFISLIPIYYGHYYFLVATFLFIGVNTKMYHKMGKIFNFMTAFFWMCLCATSFYFLPFFGIIFNWNLTAGFIVTSMLSLSSGFLSIAMFSKIGLSYLRPLTYTKSDLSSAQIPIYTQQMNQAYTFPQYSVSSSEEPPAYSEIPPKY